jgi:Ribosomal protein L14E/L6E/L27E
MKRGQFVLSIAGRDKNRLFIITEIVDETYVMIADGMLRSINKPKKKKLKHLRTICDIAGTDINEAISDKILAKLIKAASKSYRENQEGLFCQKMM